jgi:hypothetical protein
MSCSFIVLFVTMKLIVNLTFGLIDFFNRKDKVYNTVYSYTQSFRGFK